MPAKFLENVVFDVRHIIYSLLELDELSKLRCANRFFNNEIENHKHMQERWLEALKIVFDYDYYEPIETLRPFQTFVKKSKKFMQDTGGTALDMKLYIYLKYNQLDKVAEIIRSGAELSSGLFGNLDYLWHVIPEAVYTLMQSTSFRNIYAIEKAWQEAVADGDLELTRKIFARFGPGIPFSGLSMSETLNVNVRTIARVCGQEHIAPFLEGLDDRDEETDVHILSYFGKDILLRERLESFSDDEAVTELHKFNRKGFGDFNTDALSYAVRNRHLPVVQEILKRGVDKKMAIRYSVEYDDISMLRLLFDGRLRHDYIAHALYACDEDNPRMQKYILSVAPPKWTRLMEHMKDLNNKNFLEAASYSLTDASIDHLLKYYDKGFDFVGRVFEVQGVVHGTRICDMVKCLLLIDLDDLSIAPPLLARIQKVLDGEAYYYRRYLCNDLFPDVSEAVAQLLEQARDEASRPWERWQQNLLKSNRM